MHWFQDHDRDLSVHLSLVPYVMAVQPGYVHPESYVLMFIRVLHPHWNLSGSNLDQGFRFLQQVLVPVGMVSLTPIGSDQDVVIPILKIGKWGEISLPGFPTGGSKQQESDETARCVQSTLWLVCR